MIVAVKTKTVQRAEVIAKRTGNIAEGFLKSQMIDLLKEKMKNGVAHFVFKKKDGEVREAWGTICNNLMKANINGNGLSGDDVNTVKYWDVEKGGFRSLRFENLIQVF